MSKGCTKVCGRFLSDEISKFKKGSQGTPLTTMETRESKEYLL